MRQRHPPSRSHLPAIPMIPVPHRVEAERHGCTSPSQGPKGVFESQRQLGCADQARRDRWRRIEKSVDPLADDLDGATGRRLGEQGRSVQGLAGGNVLNQRRSGQMDCRGRSRQSRGMEQGRYRYSKLQHRVGEQDHFAASRIASWPAARRRSTWRPTTPIKPQLR